MKTIWILQQCSFENLLKFCPGLKKQFSKKRKNKCKSQVLTAEKKTLTFVLPFFGELFLQTKAKLRKGLKRTLGCCKIQIVFQYQRDLSNVFHFKDPLPYDLVLGINFSVEDGETIMMKLTGT